MPAMQLQTGVTLFALTILLALQCWCVNTACSGTCYSLEPRPAPPPNSELDTLHSIRCQLGCIEQVRFKSPLPVFDFHKSMHAKS